MEPSPWRELLVVQVGDSIACSFAAKLMVDLGCECVLVELPAPSGRLNRQGTVDDDIDPGLSASFTYLNWSKKSVTCDYARPEGIDLLRKICASADVLIRQEFDEELEEYWEGQAHALPSSLIELKISAFGEGPYAGYRADGTAILSLMGLTYTDGDPDREPLAVRPDLCEYFVGLDAFDSILAALYPRTRTGEGCRIELSMLDSALKLDEYNLIFPQSMGLARKRYYSRGIQGVGPEVLECQDGYVVGGINRLGSDLALLIERPDLIDDPLFIDPEYRMHHWDELNRLIEDWMRTHSREEASTRAQELRIPIAPLFRVAELLENEHVRDRGSVRWVADGTGTKIPLVGPLFRLGSYVPRSEPAPRPGEHTREWFEPLIGGQVLDEARRGGIV